MTGRKTENRPPRRGGRPPQEQAGELRERILAVATELFLTQGYGATSIEAIAKQAGISKRTFYHRFTDKADLFGAVVHHLVTKLRPAQSAPLLTGGSLKEILQRLAKAILRASLAPEALALHRLIVGESLRFPELAMIVDREGSRREAMGHIADLLMHQAHLSDRARALLAAEQFLQMVVSIPQRRALGLGPKMAATEYEPWAQEAVDSFLYGCIAHRPLDLSVPTNGTN